MDWMSDEENREALREFLSIHDIDLDQVREIRFTNQNFMVFVYETDEDGNRITERNYAKGKWVKLKYKTEIPTWA